ncbi:MAG: hypothetical protein ACOC6C_02440 [Verrucomicrobiota bacterium]
MDHKTRLKISLLLMRLSVFAVMLVWTLDKFLRPEHAASVYRNFYFIDGLGNVFMYVIGSVELIIIVLFLAGIMKRFTYGLTLVLHGISTLSSFKQYFNPYDGSNILFYAAWPMLAACVALYVLRDEDTLLSFTKQPKPKKVAGA